MNQTLIFFIIFLIFLLGFVLGTSSQNITGFFVANVGENSLAIENNSLENELPVFRIYTKALCKNVSDFTVCWDEVYVNCGGFQYLLPESIVNGEGIFKKGWEDPRLG